MDLTLATELPEREGFFLVEIDRFQGPLDLLLHLIRTQDIDIFDIPIARITDQFLKAIKSLDVGDLDGAGEFLEMAATLIRIKAQMLLPRPGEDDEEDPRAELVRRLLEYEQIREITSRLRVAEAERGRRFAKGYIPPRPKPVLADVPLETTWEEVFAAAVRVEMPVPRQVEHHVITRPVSMEEKSILILDALRRTARVQFSRLLTGFRERSHGVMTFLAGLELTRRRVLVMRQAKPFAELWIYRRDEETGEVSEAEVDGVDAGVDGGVEGGVEE
ncbi:MAG TPA: segregation/condensation protein A [Longimicrobiales bacterium]|nr:segregation/condensation protein A [Longimicrobiales bacterium]